MYKRLAEVRVRRTMSRRSAPELVGPLRHAAGGRRQPARGRAAAGEGASRPASPRSAVQGNFVRFAPAGPRRLRAGYVSTALYPKNVVKPALPQRARAPAADRAVGGSASCGRRRTRLGAVACWRTCTPGERVDVPASPSRVNRNAGRGQPGAAADSGDRTGSRRAARRGSAAAAHIHPGQRRRRQRYAISDDQVDDTSSRPRAAPQVARQQQRIGATPSDLRSPSCGNLLLGYLSRSRSRTIGRAKPASHVTGGDRQGSGQTDRTAARLSDRPQSRLTALPAGVDQRRRSSRPRSARTSRTRRSPTLDNTSSRRSADRGPPRLPEDAPPAST